MFRKMRRQKQELSGEECIDILIREPRGVLAVKGEDGYPYAFPMNQIYIDGKLYFHCAKEGHKVDALKNDGRASFCIMDKGYKNDGEWSWNIKSVVVFGRIKILEDTEKAKKAVQSLGIKHYPAKEEAESLIERAFDRALILEMTIDHMSGKLVNES